MALQYGQRRTLRPLDEEEERRRRLEYGQVRRREPAPRVGPRTAVDQDGFSIDLSRPQIPGREPGTHATEESITLQLEEGGKWYNIPSIVNGRRVSQREAADHARVERDRGWVYPNYNTLEEAEQAAPLRSERIGQARQEAAGRLQFGNRRRVRGAEEEDVTPEDDRGIWERFTGMFFQEPDEETIADMQEYYDPANQRLIETARRQAALSGGFLSEEDFMPASMKEMRHRMRERVDESYEGFEEDPWWTILQRNLQNWPRHMRSAIAGVMRSGEPLTAEKLRDNARRESTWNRVPMTADPTMSRANMEIAQAWIESGKLEVPEGMHPVTALEQFLMTPEGQEIAEQDARSQPMALKGQEWWDEDRQALKENLPRVRPRSMKYYAAGMIEGALKMGPSAAATVLTRNPTFGAAIMGTQVYGETYGAMRDRGYTHEQAQQYAAFSASVELLTERIPLSVLTKNNYRGLRRILAAAGAEAIQEPITELLQSAYEWGILHEEDAWDDIGMRLVDAGIIGFGVGGMLASPVAMADQFTTPANQELTEEEEILERVRQRVEERASVPRETQRMQEELATFENDLNNPESENFETYEEEGYVRRTEEGEAQILPKGKRERSRRRTELQRKRKEAAATERGVDPEHAGPTVDVLEAEDAKEHADIQTAPQETITPAQRDQGNYKHGRFTYGQMEVAIETPAGEVRTGVDPQGVPWQQTMNSSYGYFVGKPGADVGEPARRPRAQPTDLDARIDQIAEERADLPPEIREHAKRATMTLDFEQSQPAIRALIDNGRADIADVIVDRFKRNAAEPVGRPGVPETHPRYAEIQADLEARKAEAQQQADQLENLANLRKEEATDPYGAVPTEETGKPRPTEGVDAYVGPDLNFPIAYVVNQENADGSFDEHKVMIGYRSAGAAEEAYRADFEPAPELVSMTAMTQPQLREWLNQPEHTRPVSTGRDIPEGSDAAPVFSTVEETTPTAERYTLRGKRPVGAPPKVKTLDDVDQQIDDILAVMEDSALIPSEAWIWYEHSGAAIRDIARGDPAKMHQVVQVLAILSQATGVTANTSNFVKAAYEIARGNTSPLVGIYPNKMAKTIDTVLSGVPLTTDLPNVGDKMMNFYRNLYDATFNTNKWPDAVTVDRWIARILNYRSDAISATQYEYAMKVVQDAVKRYNARNNTAWQPKHAQAAIWVHERSRDSMEKKGVETPVDSFADALATEAAHITFEAVPSTSVPASAEIIGLPFQEKADYTQAMMGVIYEREKNLLLEEFGIPIYNNRRGSGGYEGNIAPNEITGVMMLKEGGNHDHATANAIGRAYMYIYQQDSVIWYRPDFRGDATKHRKFSQAVTFRMRDSLSPEHEQMFFAALQEALGPGAGYTKSDANDITVIDVKNENGIPQSQLKPRAFVAKMQALAEEIGEEIGLERLLEYGAESQVLTHDWTGDPNGEALIEEVQGYAAERGRSDLPKRVRNWRQSAEAVTRDWTQRRSRPRVAASVPVDRLQRGSDLQRAVYGRFGDVNEDVDTTEALKYYDLTPVVEKPELVNKLVEDLGYQVEVFSFEPGRVRIPKLKKQNYDAGYVWIYDPAAEHGSFKDEQYTRAWRVTHEAAHGITERFMQARYGDSKRYGRLGRPMKGQRGVKAVEVDLEPLTLAQAQRAVEWEDVTFRVQRMLLHELGIRIDDVTFAREYNTNISDAVYRSTTGDFGNPGEYGFVPSAVLPELRDVLESLEQTEQTLAAEQGREPTEGINLDTWEPVTDADLIAAVQERLGRDIATREIMFAAGPDIPRNLNLTPEESAMEQRLIDRIVEKGVEGMWDEYVQLEHSKRGFVLNTDVARELSEDYLADRTQSNAVHEPASWLIKRFYERLLARETPEGRLPVTMFTAGGTGAGKSTGSILDDLLGLPEITYDTNLTGIQKSIEKIQDALDAGRAVEIMYTWRDPVEAFDNGVLPRAERQRQEYGSGRTLGINTHMDTYIHGYETITALIDHFGETAETGDPRVTFSVVDNSRGKGNAVTLSSINALQPTNLDYNSLEGQLYGVLEQARQDGRISEATYQGVLAATRGTVNRSQTDVGRAVREEPEPRRPRGTVDSVELLRRIAQEFVARYPNSPNVTIAPTVNSLPPRVRSRIRSNAPKGIAGMFVPAQEGAQIYLIAENIKGARHALSVLAHESVGHYGLRSILGADYDVTMDKIFKSHNAAVKRAARRNSIALTSQRNRRLAAEEFVAYEAQKVIEGGPMPKGTWFSELIDMVKIAIARLRGVTFSDTEVLRLITKARKFTSTPAGLEHGASRNMPPPVIGYRAWQAFNQKRVPDSAEGEVYLRELSAQERAGNLDMETADTMRQWVSEQPGRIDKYELLKRLQQLGNEQAMFSSEYDGRRNAILNGDTYDAGFDIEEGSQVSRAWNYLVFKAQDKFVDLLNVQKQIEQQTGAPLPEEIDAYLQEELYHGRIKHRTDEYHERMVKPLVAEIRDSDYTWDEVEWYLYARHAPEANAQLYKINKASPAAEKARRQAIEEANEVYADRPAARKRAIESAEREYAEHVRERLEKDPGLKALSGMSNQEALDVFEVLKEKGDIRQLDGIAARVDAMTAENRRVIREAGLENQETIDAWEDTYDYYVPLKGFQDGPGNTTWFPKKGKGFDTGGAIQKRRMGRRSKAANILANIVAQHQSSLVLAEKAKVGRSVLELAKNNPNPDLWTVNELPVTRHIDKATGLVQTRRDPLHRLRDNVVRVKVDGKDYIVTFNENYEPGLRIARSLKNLSGAEINMLTSALLGLNRVLSAVNTSFNPEFVISNLIRDLQTAAINLNATDAANVKKKIMADVFKAHRGIRRYLGLWSFKDKQAADFWRQEFEEFRALGGQVGWLDNYKDVQDLERSLYREMHDRDSGLVSWNTLTKAGKYIEMENQAIENAVRLSAFHHAKKFMSPQKAASLAKNLTVNFNRKGDLGTNLNSLYLFYNASIQGMTIMWRSMKTKRARNVMLGLIAFYAAMDILNRMIAGDDDDGENRYDKIPFYVRERNMILMLPERWQPEDPETYEDYFITIPLPYGYNMLALIGSKIGAGVDYVGIGNKRELDPWQGAFEIVATALGSFNPIGTGPTPLQTVIPTVLQPLVQTSENTAWHGGPVYPEPNSFDPAPPPESQWAWRSTPEHVKALAELLNRLGGGNEVRPAKVEFLDISPETIQLWQDFLTGGAGRFVTNLVELGVMAKEQEVDTRNVPFLRRLVGKTDEREVQGRYYELREQILRGIDERDAAREGIFQADPGPDRVAARQRLADIEEAYSVEIQLNTLLSTTERSLTRIRQQRRAVEERNWPQERIDEEVEELEKRMTDRMNRFNSRYNELLREQLEAEATAMLPLIQSGDREQIVANFREQGMPAMADLIEALPARPPPAARSAIEEAAG